jgi:predicted lipoprotein with Yx(FWY)xxD motif
MKRLLLAGSALVAAIALAACGGAGGDSSNPSAAAPSSNGAATVSVQEIGDAGRVLVDSTGKALYASDEEAQSAVVCTDSCVDFWTPLTIEMGAPSGSSVPGTLGVVERPDGTKQVTFDGKRLYSFTQDAPGEVTGDGFSDAFDGQQFTWHVVSLDGASNSGTTGTTGNTGGLPGYSTG